MEEVNVSVQYKPKTLFTSYLKTTRGQKDVLML